MCSWKGEGTGWKKTEKHVTHPGLREAQSNKINLFFNHIEAIFLIPIPLLFLFRW